MHLNLKVKGKPQHIEVYILISSFRMQSRIHAILLEALAVAPRANSVAAEIEAENFTRESKRSITSTISMRVSQIDIRGSLLSLSVFSTFVHIPQNITVSAHGPCVCTTHTGAYPPPPPPLSLSSSLPSLAHFCVHCTSSLGVAPKPRDRVCVSLVFLLLPPLTPPPCGGWELCEQCEES